MRVTLAHHKTEAIITDGRYQIYHLIKDLLIQTGPASLFISSYSINEEFLRFLIRNRSILQIRHITLLLDFKSIAKGLHLAKFAGEVADLVLLGSNHSKVILIENDQWQVSVVTSQNLTRGNRIESSIICTEPAVFQALDSSLSDVFKHCIPINDIFKRATGENPRAGQLSHET